MTYGFDLGFVLALQHLVTSVSWGPALVVFCARWCIFLDLLLVVPLAVSRHARARHGIYEAVWGVALAILFVSGIAFVVHRARPFLATPAVIAFIPPPYNSSFPSGHTAAAVAIACAFYVADKRIGWIAFAIALVTAFGRMAAGVHYPTDILGGALVGLFAFLVVRLAHERIRARDISRSAAHHHHT